MKKPLNFKRSDRQFTITEVMVQVIKHMQKHGDFPSVINLPPEERVFLTYIIYPPNELSTKRVNKFMGIPLGVSKEKQAPTFHY